MDEPDGIDKKGGLSSKAGFSSRFLTMNIATMNPTTANAPITIPAAAPAERRPG
jgi:hypothetical protein